jgi:UPF0755 protein
MKKRGRGAIIAVVLLALVLFGALYEGWTFVADVFQPITISQNTTLIIQSGEDSVELAKDLSQKGLIHNEIAFRLWAKLQGLDAKLQTGAYELTPGMSMDTVIAKLESGKSDGERLTVIEGWRIEQIANAVSILPHLTNFNEKAFLGYAKKPSTFPDVANYPFLKNVSSMEGLLFPDTYLVPFDATAQQVLDQMLNEYGQAIQTNNLATQAAKHQLSTYQMTILASIVQREVANDSEMSLVSGIYWNRIEQPNDETVSKLDSDPTVQYARDTDTPPSSPAGYWGDLSNSGTGDTVDPNSLWNTYTHQGWTPTPISSPGLAALEAAASPAATDCYFFLSTHQGALVCSPTYAGFQQLEAKYLN